MSVTPGIALQSIREALASTAMPADIASTASLSGLGDARRIQPDRPLKHAAVLVPIYADEAAPCVLFTRRPATMRNHPNQVSFPGGSAEPEDADLIETALREAEEEVGLSADQAEVIGFLDPYVTITGFCVLPVVAAIPKGFEAVPDVREVAEVLVLPAERVLNRGIHRQHSCRINGVPARYTVIGHGREMIWGATAGMLGNFAAKLGR